MDIHVPLFLVPAIPRENRVEPVGCFRLCEHLSQLQSTGKFLRQVIYVECRYIDRCQCLLQESLEIEGGGAVLVGWGQT